MLGEFKNNGGGAYPESTKFDADANLGHPLVVIVHDFKEDFTSERFPNPRPVAFVMIADLNPLLSGGQPVLYGNAILGGTAVADRLRGYAGATNEDGTPVKLPVKLVTVQPKKKGGNPYRGIEPLAGAELDLAAKWDAKFPTALQDERQRLLDEAAARAAEEEADAKPAPAKEAAIPDDALAAAIAAL
jgi:hypothetical protein